MKKKLLLAPEPPKPAVPDRPWLTPWEKGKSGNPAGRPKGSRNKAKELAEALIGTNATNIVKKVIQMALAGNEACLKMCMDRILPSQRAIDASALAKGNTEINIVVESAKQLTDITEKSAVIEQEPVVIDVQETKNMH